MTDAHKNIDRFNGFAGLYDNTRPACPPYVVEVLTRYLGYRPRTVVDMGCGTGLSTLVWRDAADTIIGVEPNEDMLARATANAAGAENIVFVSAFSDNTGLADGIADIVTCSQSFHWMEPVSTLREIDRILKPGGVFAAYDCDWPPVCGAIIDAAYQKLDEYVDDIEANVPEYRDGFIGYPKTGHLENIRKSGYFYYVREIVFANTEPCDAERYYRFALSQGGTQVILKRNPALIEAELAAFRAAVDTYFGDKTLPVDFCYRMRLGVKKGE
ncbi:MAG: class I SAM-dependent methyltransferase [Oscillospiraceae bacterium]|nr:class I SAM-dependent methyltransferase [Oscillospiraceae bacterium]